MTAQPLRFGSDHGVLRSEDAPLLTGRGRYTDDVNLPGQAHAVFVRASVGHARIQHLDTTAAKAMPGVLAILTAKELSAAGVQSIPPLAIMNGRDGRPMFVAAMPPLAIDSVRYVGEPVVCVIAETEAQALDAAEHVAIDYDSLPAVVDPARAVAPGAPVLWDGAPNNVALDWVDGDAAAVDAAFSRAAHTVQVKLLDTRLAPATMEPRGGIAQWDNATARYTLTASTQGVAIVRNILATHVLKIPPQSLRVLTHDVGGGFGMKTHPYPEYISILIAARTVNRPVKWRNSRLDSFLSDTAGRDGVLEGELALDASGKFLALRARNLVGMGAYISTFGATFATNNTKNCLSSVYVIPAIHVNIKMVLCNTAPLGPYRGAGRPEAIMVIERLIDMAAGKMGIDPIELRRRNLIDATAMPYQTPNGPIYDSGEFASIMAKATNLADWSGFTKRRDESRMRGKLRGIGVCCFLEVAGGILDETVDLRFEADGKVALRTGVQAMGQGHLSTFPPIVAAKLGIKVSDVRLIEGDSDEVPAGIPSVASRSTMMAGGATFIACDASIEKGRRIAAHLFEAASADVEFADGTYRVSGTDRAMGILDVARRARGATDLPADLSKGLDSVEKFVSPQMSFPNGCHVTEVEIDPETGVVAIVGYTAVDDVGNMIHETIVEGQIHGGVAQGLGQVIGEYVRYDERGQLLTASFMDYVMLRADDLPNLKVGHHGVVCTTNPLGVKGAGESGVAGALPSALNAVLNALAERGVTHFDLPASPERVWRALSAGGMRA